MPAEWEPHAATWLTWPHDEAHWPGKFHVVHPIWARMVKELETGEDVRIIIHDDDTECIARAAMDKAGVVGRRVHLHRAPNNWSWVRDHGPTVVVNAHGERRLLHWRFNGWGEKWPHDLDATVPFAIERATGIPRVEIPMVLEGGSIDVNGAGTLVTTASCLLNPNRNPAMSKDAIEGALCKHLGVAHVIWLDHEVAGDDTSGHVDDMTRFIGPRTVLTVVERDAHDENHAALAANARTLAAARDQDGRPLDVVTVPLPAPVIHDGTRLPASYANFYIANDVVLLPVFNDPADTAAALALARAFPTRRIAAIDARDLVWGFGAFHCVTQQEPLAAT